MAKINIGSDVCYIPGFVNTDIRLEVHPNIVMDIRFLCFKNKCAEEINLGNILEHLSFEDVYIALEECRRILKDDGVLFITSPLVDKAEEALKMGEIDKERFESIVKGEGSSFNKHKIEFRAGSIEGFLTDCGFTNELLNLKAFPYLVVSNTKNPKPDSWIIGLQARKKFVDDTKILEIK